MGDNDKQIFTATVAGRDVSLYRPTEDQVVAWMGVVGLVGDSDPDVEDADQVKELVGDVTLLLDALLASFVEDKDRKQFRRDVVMGNARLSDLFQVLLSEPDQKQTKSSKKATGVRRA